MASAGEMFQTVLRNDARAIELLMQWWHRKWQTLISDFAGPENLRMRVVLVISVAWYPGILRSRTILVCKLSTQIS